ncbi:carbohydrate ABC transporter permease [Jingyaoa shaoxingensis]|uniref:Carbohydrate ABC transporter permease n=1 Tax=Jingyaoa shaoxingensis TaxID=2763671 RepID=A0ABR7NAD2_9FIRM|nr:carbohydrate ABC transporter permease [Jingyaoa shaoxingensis]MBC8572757.1 carbohydrate ABC transporter permease [Jingyaoa shaoxingensis]
MKNKRRIKPKKICMKTIFWIVVVCIMFVNLVPLLWMLSASFKTIVDIMNPKKMFVFTPTIKNYIEVFTKYSFLKPIINSLIVSTGATVLACLFGLPAAYAIARYKQNKLSLIILAVRIIPAITFLVPWYIIFSKLKMTGTYTSLIMANLLVSLPLIVWIVTPYFGSIPKELEEAAFIDGSSVFNSFIRIMIPLSAPGIFTAAILSFIYAWNNFLFALILSSSSTKTLPMAVFNFISYTSVNWGGLMAAAVVITGPVIIVSIALQKYVVSGLTAGAVKG